jgi:hypothetical protein
MCSLSSPVMKSRYAVLAARTWTVRAFETSSLCLIEASPVKLKITTNAQSTPTMPASVSRRVRTLTLERLKPRPDRCVLGAGAS